VPKGITTPIITMRFKTEVWSIFASRKSPIASTEIEKIRIIAKIANQAANGKFPDGAAKLTSANKKPKGRKIDSRSQICSLAKDHSLGSSITENGEYIASAIKNEIAM